MVFEAFLSISLASLTLRLTGLLKCFWDFRISSVFFRAFQFIKIFVVPWHCSIREMNIFLPLLLTEFISCLFQETCTGYWPFPELGSFKRYPIHELGDLFWMVHGINTRRNHFQEWAVSRTCMDWSTSVTLHYDIVSTSGSGMYHSKTYCLLTFSTRRCQVWASR